MMIKGIGVDIAEITRIKLALERSGQGFIDKVFTQKEYNYCKNRADKISCLAARFAAKEATLKAFHLGIDKMPLHAVEVIHDEDGSPGIQINNETLTRTKEESGITHIWLSLSHSENFVTAFVVCEGIQ